MEKLRENDIYTATVEGYSSEGLGIVRILGAVVFVPQAIRGEEIDVKITKVMKTAAAGQIVKIRKASPERMKPECPYFGKCGGCDFQHMSYTEELSAKRQRVQDAITRIGGIDLEVEEILGAKDPLHYRNKSIHLAEINTAGYIQYSVKVFFPDGKIDTWIVNHASIAETENEIQAKADTYKRFNDEQKKKYVELFGAPEFDPTKIGLK